MKKLSILALFLALLLSACSGRTAYVVNVDVLSLIEASGESTQFTLSNTGSNTITLPSANGQELSIPLPDNVINAIDSATLSLALNASLPSGSTTMPTVDVQVCFAPTGTTDVCANAFKTYSFQITSTGPVNTTPFDLKSIISSLQSGAAVAVKLTLSGSGTVDITITKLTLEVKAHPFNAIPTQL